MKKFLCLILSLLYLSLTPMTVFAVSVNKVPDYQNLVKLEENEVLFTTKLSNKYIGKDYIFTNNYEKPIIIKTIELKNNRGIVPVYKNSQYVMTPGSYALSFVGGFLAIPTFGISLVLLAPAITEITVKNNNIKKEAKNNITKVPQKEIVVEPSKSFEVKAIFDKTQAVNRTSNIKFTCFDSDNKQEFVVTANAEDEKIEASSLSSKEEAVRQLTDSGLKPNSKVYVAQSIIEDDANTLGLYLDSGMSANTKYMGMPLIVNAVVKNKPDIVMLLIDNGVDVNTKFGKMTALQSVIYKNYPEIAIKLLDKGANPNAAGFGSKPPLIMAVKRNQIDVVKTLVEKGANINQKAIKLAQKKKYTEIEKLLTNSNR